MFSGDVQEKATGWYTFFEFADKLTTLLSVAGRFEEYHRKFPDMKMQTPPTRRKYHVRACLCAYLGVCGCLIVSACLFIVSTLLWLCRSVVVAADGHAPIRQTFRCKRQTLET